jgi:hypothetical protein
MRGTFAATAASEAKRPYADLKQHRVTPEMAVKLAFVP